MISGNNIHNLTISQTDLTFFYIRENMPHIFLARCPCSIKILLSAEVKLRNSRSEHDSVIHFDSVLSASSLLLFQASGALVFLSFFQFSTISLSSLFRLSCVIVSFVGGRTSSIVFASDTCRRLLPIQGVSSSNDQTSPRSKMNWKIKRNTKVFAYSMKNWLIFYFSAS